MAHELKWRAVPITMTGWYCTGCDVKIDPRLNPENAARKFAELHTPEDPDPGALWRYVVHRQL